MMSMMNEEFQKFVQQIKDGLVSIGAAEAELNANLDHLGMTINEHQAALLKEQVKHVIATHLTDRWPTVLSPGQFATMPFILSSVASTRRAYTCDSKIRRAIRGSGQTSPSRRASWSHNRNREPSKLPNRRRSANGGTPKRGLIVPRSEPIRRWLADRDRRLTAHAPRWASKTTSELR